MRTLYYVPVVHALVETGARGPRYIAALEQLIGSERTARHLTKLEELWRILPNTVTENVEAGPVPWSRVHLFADSIPRPMKGNPDALVHEWFVRFLSVDSPMATLLADMVQRGATVHGTEDDLLVAKHSQHLLEAEQWDMDVRAVSRRYTGLRDACVAMHVNRMVPNGHAAVLIMGAMHAVDALLATEPDWRVERIDLLDADLSPATHPLG